MRGSRWWLIGEVVLTYAVPAYFWLWGVITLPMWVLGTAQRDPIAMWNLVAVLCGFLGGVGVIALLTQVISRQPPSRLKFICISALCLCGVFGIWIVMTGQFYAFELNWFTLIAMIAPTLCTLHLLAIWYPSTNRSKARTGT